MTEPAGPFDAVIATLNVADGVGTLSRPDGSTLRFGASACRGFAPVVGAKVRVTATRPHPLGGLTASSLELVTPAEQFDALLSARDRALGVFQERTPEEAASIGLSVGWIVVLLDAPVPTTPAAFTDWANQLGLPGVGVQVEAPSMARLTFGEAAPLCYPGNGPFPATHLATIAGVPSSFAQARGFLVMSLGPQNVMSRTRLMVGDVDDPWDRDGRMRSLSRLAAMLVRRGPGVILPMARVALSRDTFLRRLGDLEDPRSRPLFAWASLGWDSAKRSYHSNGMDAHELPDVSVEVKAAGAFAEQRAKEAAYFACHTMVHRNSALKEGERLQVPVGVLASGNLPLDVRGCDLEEWRVDALDGVLSLAAVRPGATLEKWASAPDQVSRGAYHALFRSAVQEWHRGQFVGAIDFPADGHAPEIVVEVYRLAVGVMMNTLGAGRSVQPGGTHRVELISVMAADDPRLAKVLGRLAGGLHRHPPNAPYKAGDTVSMPVPELDAAGFLLLSANSISFGAGDDIELLEALPLSAAELAQSRREGTRALVQLLSRPTTETRGPRWALRGA